MQNEVLNMSIKPQYETYRYTSELCRTNGQSIVECRLPGSEINAVLAINATATPTECVCGDGEVNLKGKLLLSVVYEDANKSVCRVERGAEFFVKNEKKEITPACSGKASFVVKNVTTRREGSGLYLSALVEAETRIFGSVTAEYLTGGENIAAKLEEKTLVRTVCLSGETEIEDEFETEYFADVLLHGERAFVTSAKVFGGEIEVTGEVALNLCALKEDGELCPYEKLVPFKMQIPCDEQGALNCSSRVVVSSAKLSVTTDEEKGQSKILAELILSADCTLYIFEKINCATDAFSTVNETKLIKEKRQGRYLNNERRLVERISGGAALSPEAGNGFALLSPVLPRGEVVYKKRCDEKGVSCGADVEGVVEAEVILRGEDGLHKASTLSLPFAFPVTGIDGEDVEAECLVCGLSVRKRPSGEVDAEATVKIVLRSYEQRETEYVCEVVEGEEYEKNECAFSVFVPREGDGLWEVAAKLKRAPEEVAKNNPNLEFPVKKDARIVVYRQKD